MTILGTHLFPAVQMYSPVHQIYRMNRKMDAYTSYINNLVYKD